MRILITRPRDDAEPVANELRALGHETMIEPLLKVEPVADAVARLDQVQAVLLTSRNGIRALAEITERRDIPVFTVGDATAALAREHGFTEVESASGDSTALAELVADRLDPAAGALLHGSGAAVAGDLAGSLAAGGFTVRCEVLYEAKPVTSLSLDLRDALAQGALDTVLFFSPRTAQTFVTLIKEAGLMKGCERLTAVCLSPAVGRALGPLDMREIRIADRPDAGSMVAAVADICTQTEPETQALDTPDRDETAADPGEVILEARPAAEPEVLEPETGPKPRILTGAMDDDVIIEAEPAPRRGFRDVSPRVWVILGVVLAAGAGVAGWPLWQGYLPGASAQQGAVAGIEPDAAAGPAEIPDAAPAAASADITRLDERLDMLERALSRPDQAAPTLQFLAERLDGIEKGVIDLSANIPPQGGATGLPPEFSKRLIDLESRTQTLGSDAVAGKSASEALLKAEIDKLSVALAALSERLVAAETAAARPPETEARIRASALVFAVGQLREALTRSDPFAAELTSLRAIAGGDAEIEAAIAPLGDRAGRGIATVAELRRRFPAAAEAARGAARTVDGDWLDRTLARLSTVVSVRRVGDEVEGDAPRAVLARAEARLDAGDLKGADDQLAGLAGASAEAMADWRRDAAARFAAERASAALTRLVVGRLAEIDWSGTH